MARALFVAGNWKMNLRLEDSCSLASELAGGVRPNTAVDIAIFPQFPWILAVREAVKGSSIYVGAQNGHASPFGAFTGEVSIALVAPHCDYILAGHSERRHIFGETDEQIGEKVRAIVNAGSRAILCVGETLDERDAGDAERVVTRQLRAGLQGLKDEQLSAVTLAYEPVWAIGTGVAATPNDAQGMCHAVRNLIGAEHGANIAAQTRVLYGGSVIPDNAGELFGQPDIDGGLVGGASLKANSFLAIIGEATRISNL